MKGKLRLLQALSLSVLVIAGCSSNSGSSDEDVNTAENTIDNGNIDLNGDYVVLAPLDEVSRAVPECQPAAGSLTVTGTTIRGVVDDVIVVTGNIESDGTITGGFAFEGGSKFADYSGMLDGTDLAGTWASITGCSGTWRAEKVSS